MQHCRAVTGDVGVLGALAGLDYLDLVYSAVTGDVGGLAGCALHDWINLGQTAVTGWPLHTTSGCTFVVR